MLVGLPRGLVRGVVGHCALAGDFQHTVGGEIPLGVLAADTGGDSVYLQFSFNVSDTVPLGIILRVGVSCDGERNIVAGIKEDVSSDARHTVGDVERSKLGICLEHIFAQSAELAILSDSYLGELGAVVEGIAVNSGDGIGDNDARQTAVAECAPANALKLSAFLKADAFQLAAAEEVEFADVGDILAEYNMLELVLVGFPRSLIGRVIGHCAAAADGQHTIRGQNPFGVLTAGSGGEFLRRTRSLFIGDAVFLGICLCIGVSRN